MTRALSKAILLINSVKEGGQTVRRILPIILTVAILSLFLGGVALGQTGNGTAVPANVDERFSDVSKDHWAYDDIKYLADRGIITGLPGGQYQGQQALDRYSAAALISRAVKYLQNNPEIVTLQDLDVLRDLMFKISDNMATLQGQVDSLQGGSDLREQVVSNQEQISELGRQVESLSKSDTGELATRVDVNLVISLVGVLAGIAAIALHFFAPTS